MFEMVTNYYTSYLNINRALFRMLDDSIDNNFKVSNNPNLKRWNPTMSVQMILTQLKTAYSQPTGTTMCENNKIFWAPFGVNEVPESLFLRLKCCQKVYTDTVGKLRSATPPAVQHFSDEGIRGLGMQGVENVQAAYQRKLMVLNLRMTSGTGGYVNQNMIHVWMTTTTSMMRNRSAQQTR